MCTWDCGMRFHICHISPFLVGLEGSATTMVIVEQDIRLPVSVMEERKINICPQIKHCHYWNLQFSQVQLCRELMGQSRFFLSYLKSNTKEMKKLEWTKMRPNPLLGRIPGICRVPQYTGDISQRVLQCWGIATCRNTLRGAALTKAECSKCCGVFWAGSVAGTSHNESGSGCEKEGGWLAYLLW